MIQRYGVIVILGFALFANADNHFLNNVHAYHIKKAELASLNNPAFNAFVDKLAREPSKLTLQDICKLHNLIYRSTNSQQAGKIRTSKVRVNNMTPPQAARIRPLMQQLLTWLHHTHEHPLAKSSDFHLKFVDIHPFINGNGRTARTLFAILLLRNGYPLPTFLPEERKAYVKGINQALMKKDKKLYNRIMLNAVKRSFKNIKGKY